MASSEAIAAANLVIGIAGPAGAGKSTVAGALARALGQGPGGAALVHIDDYQRITGQPIARIAQWQSRGADFDEFDIPVLPDHLARLKRGETVTEPLSLREIRPARFIVFETHFGRVHRATGQHIDFLVWLDTPLDVALARNLRDLLAPVLADPRGGGRERIAWLDRYLETYLRDLRPLIALQQARVRAGADLVVDPLSACHPGLDPGSSAMDTDVAGHGQRSRTESGMTEGDGPGADVAKAVARIRDALAERFGEPP